MERSPNDPGDKDEVWFQSPPAEGCQPTCVHVCESVWVCTSLKRGRRRAGDSEQVWPSMQLQRAPHPSGNLFTFLPFSIDRATWAQPVIAVDAKTESAVCSLGTMAWQLCPALHATEQNNQLLETQLSNPGSSVACHWASSNLLPPQFLHQRCWRNHGSFFFFLIDCS